MRILPAQREALGGARDKQMVSLKATRYIGVLSPWKNYRHSDLTL